MPNDRMTDSAHFTDQEASLDDTTRAYQAEYSDRGFWRKVAQHAQKAGKATLSHALTLYYAAQDADTPVWVKTTIYGALGYFVSPIDAIPDMIPITGYTDDMGVLAAAICVAAAHIKPEHRHKAGQSLKRWLG